jgi:hypothetical protein
MIANEMILRGDEIWQWGHDGTGPNLANTRLVQRLDGFCSLDAGGNTGTIITRPLVFDGGRLVLNVKAEGFVRAAILDQSGTVLNRLGVPTMDKPRTETVIFGIDECDSFTGDSVRHVVTWNGRSDISRFAGEVVRLRFEMQNAKLFAFQFDRTAPAAEKKRDPYIFDEINPVYYKTDPAKLIRIKNAGDVAEIRGALADYIWQGAGLPTSKMPDSVEEGITDGRYESLYTGNLARIDRITTVTEPGLNSIAYLFIPKNANGELVIYHQGHDGDFVIGIDTIRGLVENGYAVLGFAMPQRGMNNKPTVYLERFGYFKLENHIHLKLLDTPIRPFIEPVVVGVNYALSLGYGPVHMTGLSGGGWTTTVCAAVDDRISHSYPVAGSCPMYLKSESRRDWGDYEQTVRDLYRTANYLEMYILGAAGPSRRQMQVINRYDSCCYANVKFRTYEKVVGDTAADVGGRFDVLCDESHREHKISTKVMEAILADLRT